MSESPANVQRHAHDDEIDLARLWGLLVDSRKLMAVIAAAVVLLGVVYALLATPVYRADALLQVEKKKGGLPGFAEVSELFEHESSAVGEIEILRSRMVLGEAARALGMAVSLRRIEWPLLGRFTAPAPALDPGPLYGAVTDSVTDVRVLDFIVPPTLEGEAFQLRAEESGFSLWYEDREILRGQSGVSLSDATGRIRLEIATFTSRPGDRFELIRHSDLSAITGIRNGFAVAEQGRNSGILSISFVGPSPQRNRAILDAVADAYLMQNIRRMSAEAEKSLEFLEQQLPEIRDNLEKAEKILNSYRLDSGSVDLTTETQQVLARLVTLEAKENELLLQEKELGRLYTREHPAFRTLIQQQQAVRDEKSRLNDQIKSLPETQQEILRMTRDVQVNQEIYVQMLNKTQELKVVRAGTVGNVRIIDRAATAPEPIKPRRGLIVALSLVVGGMLGVATVLVRAAFFRGIETPGQIEDTGLPVYAAVPLSQSQTTLPDIVRRKTRGPRGTSKTTVLALADPADLAIESLRSLRTSLHFAMMDADNHVLMISGPSPGVGKSFISVNLAVVQAQVQGRVLLIDADMRKGRLHQEFNLSSREGLSGWLAGRCTLEQVIQSTQISNLHFLARGEAPPNPSELLMHPRFAELLEELSGRYDLIIVDTPPILAVTDAAIIGQYAGTSLMVARFGKNSVHEVEVARHRFSQNGVSIKGAILNCMEKRAANAYGYYAYSYGDQEEK
jgi:tyrosine-protein kinase Etk/Wzc